MLNFNKVKGLSPINRKNLLRTSLWELEKHNAINDSCYSSGEYENLLRRWGIYDGSDGISTTELKDLIKALEA